MAAREIRDYYAREDVQDALLRVCKGREVVGVFSDGGFSARPNAIIYQKDILSQVGTGVVAFHGSLERWENPMAVGSRGYEKTRTGWDLILDFDCGDTEHGKVAVSVFLEALKKHGVKSASVKFTGGTGFHMGIPFECFPSEVDYVPSREQYPDLARKVALYLRDYSKAALEKALLSKWNAEELAEKSGTALDKVLTKDGINPYAVVDVDPVLISPRHLFRLPYSLHEKSLLVSLPLRDGEIDEFRKEDASASKVRFFRGFLDKYEEDEASMLVMEAVDWAVKNNLGKRDAIAERKFSTPQKAVPLEFSPPCIKAILAGIPDGKKRSLLVLVNFLSSLGWGFAQVEAQVVEWNKKNTPPLSDSYVRGQLAWHARREKSMLPPSCQNAGYYPSIGVCSPDVTCGGEKKTIKNPVNYAIRKSGRAKETEEKEGEKKKRKKRS